MNRQVSLANVEIQEQNYPDSVLMLGEDRANGLDRSSVTDMSSAWWAPGGEGNLESMGVN